jgi:hypothetical protein
MIEAGMEAILIKVAGIGLTPKHLGKTLAEMQPTLLKLVSKITDLSPPLINGSTRMQCTALTSAAKEESTRASLWIAPSSRSVSNCQEALSTTFCL